MKIFLRKGVFQKEFGNGWRMLIYEAKCSILGYTLGADSGPGVGYKKNKGVYPMTGRGNHVELKWETDGLYRRWRLGLEKKASYPPIRGEIDGLSKRTEGFQYDVVG